MSQFSRRTFFELAGASLICGCSNASSISGDTGFPVLAFSDIHFDPFFDPSLFAKLNADDPDKWASTFASSAIKTPSLPGADTNYPLLALALESIRQNRGASPFLLFAGDLLGHQIKQRYFNASGSSDEAAMIAFTDKVLTFVAHQIRAAAGSVPVFFSVGNCESYNGNGPDRSFLANNADVFFNTMLLGLASRQDFLSGFTAGGYYAVEPAGTNLMIVGLNTIMFTLQVQNPDGSENNQQAVDTELAWLDVKLASARSAGKKVWLLMHAPPGEDEGSTASTIQSNGQIAAATMMWEPNYQREFLRILAKYPGLISFALAGHTHADEYRVMSDANVVEGIPGISPVFGNDPAYKIFRLDARTYAPADYNSVNYDLEGLPAQFNSYYTYSQQFPLSGSLANSQASLLPQLAANQKLQSLYRKYFYSGNDRANPMTNLNWPVYWSGIGIMTGPEIVASVNDYPRGA
jgi:sphingomyelin phosphodiesterase acid-like 3